MLNVTGTESRRVSMCSSGDSPTPGDNGSRRSSRLMSDMDAASRRMVDLELELEMKLNSLSKASYLELDSVERVSSEVKDLLSLLKRRVEELESSLPADPTGVQLHQRDRHRSVLTELEADFNRVLREHRENLEKTRLLRRVENELESYRTEQYGGLQEKAHLHSSMKRVDDHIMIAMETKEQLVAQRRGLSNIKQTLKVVKLNDLLLHEAVMKNDADAVREVLDEPIDVNSRNNYGRAPIHWAASMGNTEIMNMLIAAKCDIEARDKYGMRPLLMAAWHGNKEAVKLLINAGANVNSKNKKGYGVIMCAARNNKEEVVDYLLETLENIDLEMVDNEGQTCLHQAAAEGHERIVSKLLALSANPNSTDKKSWTALHASCEKGHEEVTQLLVEGGAKLESVDKEGNTPLHVAVENRMTNITSILLQAGASSNIVNQKGNTPIHIASSTGCRGIIEALLQHGSNINCQNRMGNTPLHLAAEVNDEDTVELLISKGAELNSLNEISQSPIHIAAEKGYTEICKILLASGANIEQKEQGGRTPLYIAARGSFTAIVDMIIRTARLDYPEPEENSILKQQSMNSTRRKARFNSAPRKDQEVVEEVIRKLAWKQLKEGQWVTLAQQWAFTPDQIKAIQHEYTGAASYKEHGYRMMTIWVDSLEAEVDPLQSLYDTLIAIGEKRLADSVKKKISTERGSRKDQQCSSCKVS